VEKNPGRNTLTIHIFYISQNLGILTLSYEVPVQSASLNSTYFSVLHFYSLCLYICAHKCFQFLIANSGFSWEDSPVPIGIIPLSCLLHSQIGLLFFILHKVI
jgi:hypothetical protein